MQSSTFAVGRKMALDLGKSECPLLAELSVHVKENSKSGIVSCLTRIKSDQKCFQRFVDHGGLCLLVELLRYRNAKVMDTALSILADGCLLSRVRDELQETKIASYVVWIVKNLQSGETMHCRACRLMGNLSESFFHARSLCEAGAIIALTQTLSSRTNAQTLGMAVRAIRNIWSIYEGRYSEHRYREDILQAGTIKAITSVLVQSRKKLLERDDHAKYIELVESCLKAMWVFLASFDHRSGEQMRGEKDLDGYRCILDYCRAKNETAIKCLHKLCHFPEVRLDLGCSGAIEYLIEAVRVKARSSAATKTRSSPWTSASDCRYKIIESLCMLCREAVNRAKIKSGLGIEVMLERLHEVDDERYHELLLYGLGQYISDDQGIAIMIKHGIVDVIVGKLKKMTLVRKTTTNDAVERTGKSGKKRTTDMSPIMRSDAKYKRMNERSERFSMDYPRYDLSPGSRSNGCYSPSSTPPLSPCDTASDIDENADDNYSPICSDNEWLDNDDSTEVGAEEFTESVRIYGKLEKKDDDGPVYESDKTSTSSTDEPRRSDFIVHLFTFSMLGMLSYCTQHIDGLCDPTTIRALVGYIAAAKANSAIDILARIAGNQSYFVKVLLQGFVFEAQTLYGTDKYTRALCDVAETGGAFGELATLLLRGHEPQRFVVALSVPFVIETREKLRILLNNHGGLDLIFRALENSENPLHEEAVLAISRLAVSLGIAVPDGNSDKSNAEGIAKLSTDDDNDSSAEEIDASGDEVTFELDDGSTVRASRTSLCEKSVVFAAMLEGSFNESGKSRVKLKKASNDGLVALLSASSRVNGDHAGRRIEALLDAVLLADQFLMSEVSERLTEISFARLSHENLYRAWNWSRENSCHELKCCCVKFFLTSSMTRAQRLRAFRDFRESTNFRDFMTDVRRLIDESLAPVRIR